MDILALEPWLGGSHRQFLEQWSARSTHDVSVLGLSPHNWKWRMRTAHWELGRRIRRENRQPPDVLFASDYLDLPGFHGWLPPEWAGVPSLLYFHENQLTYPLRPGARALERDHHPALTNILSCLRADRVVFNSEYHRRDFAQAADEFLRGLPRPGPRAELEEKLARAAVVAPGIDLDETRPGAGGSTALRVLFNHRWEHDKDPVAFLEAMLECRRRGLELELVLLGQAYEWAPEGCEELVARLGASVLERGFAPSREAYIDLMGSCDVVVSSATHEFYGMAVLEAVATGCLPLLPDRLSYPDLLPEELHPTCIYRTGEELVARLLELGTRTGSLRRREARSSLRRAVERHSARDTATGLDALCEQLCEHAPG